MCKHSISKTRAHTVKLEIVGCDCAVVLSFMGVNKQNLKYNCS